MHPRSPAAVACEPLTPDRATGRGQGQCLVRRPPETAVPGSPLVTAKHPAQPEALVLFRGGLDQQDTHHALQGQVPGEFDPVENSERHVDKKPGRHDDRAGKEAAQQTQTDAQLRGAGAHAELTCQRDAWRGVTRTWARKPPAASAWRPHHG
jgi:hypothetical protein